MGSGGAFRFVLVLALACASARAQQTVTYTNGQDVTTPITITAPTNPATLTIASGTATQSGAITESGTTGAIDVTGGGTLVLSAANNYTGGTTISGGLLQIAGESNLGGVDLGGAGLGGITLEGGELLTTGAGTMTQTVTLNAGVDTLAARTNTTTTYTNTISGSPGSLTIGDANNAGTVILPNSNSYGGGTTVAKGVLEVNNSGSLGGGAVTVQSGASLNLYAPDPGFGGLSIVNLPNPITISGTGVTGQGVLYCIGGGVYQAESVSGIVTLAADALLGNGSQNATLTLGAIDLSSHTLTLGTGTGGFDLTGNITGSGGLIINSPYTQIDSGDNTFTGDTDVLSGSQFDLADASGHAIAGNLTIEDGAIVEDSGGGQVAPSTIITLKGSGTMILPSSYGPAVSETVGGLEGSSADSLVRTAASQPDSPPLTLTLAGSGSYIYAGQIDDAATPPAPSLTLVKQGPGNQILSGTNSYAGPTAVNGGVLAFTHSLTTSSAISVAAGATLNLAGGNFSTSGTITNNGTMVLGNGVTLGSLGAVFTNTGILDLRNDRSVVLLYSSFVNNGVILDLPILYFQNGTSLGMLSLNTTFLPSAWAGIGTMNSGWQEQAVGDVNGDGIPDILFQKGTLIGALLMNADGTPKSWVGMGAMNAGWQLHGAGAITADGNLDLIFQDGTLLGYLEVNGSGTPVSWTGIGAMNAGWQLRAVADLTASGRPDLVFQDDTLIGALEVSTGGVPTAWNGIGAMNTGWTLADALNVTGDGHVANQGQPDLIFQKGTLLGALQVSATFQPVAWTGIGAMGSGWKLSGDY